MPPTGSHSPATYPPDTPPCFPSAVQLTNQTPSHGYYSHDNVPAPGNLDYSQHYGRNNAAHMNGSYYDMKATLSNMPVTGGEKHHLEYPESSQRSVFEGKLQESSSQPQVIYSTGDSTAITGVVKDNFHYNNPPLFVSYSSTPGMPSHPGGAGARQSVFMQSPIVTHAPPGAGSGAYSPTPHVGNYQSQGPRSHVEQRFHPTISQRHSPVRARDGSNPVRGVSANGVGISPSPNKNNLVDADGDNGHLFRVPATSPKHAAKTPPDPSRPTHPREPGMETSIQHSASRRHWHVAKSGDSQPHANRLSTRSVRKSKMHQCKHCSKSFPRPSGLETHMNIHTGQRPHRCDWCSKTFTVRSNAKRHLKTHGVVLQAEKSASPGDYKVAFDIPIVPESSEVAIHSPTSVIWMHYVVSGINQIRLESPSPAGTPRTYPKPPDPVPSSIKVVPSGNTTLVGDYRRI